MTGIEEKSEGKNRGVSSHSSVTCPKAFRHRPRPPQQRVHGRTLLSFVLRDGRAESRDVTASGQRRRSRSSRVVTGGFARENRSPWTVAVTVWESCPRTRTLGCGSMSRPSRRCNTSATCCRCTRAPLTRASSSLSRRLALVRLPTSPDEFDDGEIRGIFLPACGIVRHRDSREETLGAGRARAIEPRGFSASLARPRRARAPARRVRRGRARLPDRFRRDRLRVRTRR